MALPQLQIREDGMFDDALIHAFFALIDLTDTELDILLTAFNAYKQGVITSAGAIASLSWALQTGPTLPDSLRLLTGRLYNRAHIDQHIEIVSRECDQARQ